MPHDPTRGDIGLGFGVEARFGFRIGRRIEDRSSLGLNHKYLPGT
jgi:hypothetical protein